MAPRVSIITPSYQQARYLEACLRSVRDQEGALVEHIVVDGGSTDGSVELIRNTQDRLAWWCSEADAGQSDAINKGLSHATGEIFGWVNSDDRLLPGSLALVSERFAADPTMQVLEGHRLLETPDGATTRSPLNDPAYPDEMWMAPVINQQSTFYRMDAVREVGGVDPALHYCMDLDLWWRVLFAHGPGTFRTIGKDLAVFRLQEQSKTAAGTEGFVRETAALLMAMAQRVGDQEMYGVLESGYPSMVELRPSNARPEHAVLVRRMIVRFLLKWNATIATKDRFRMMSRARSIIGSDVRTHGSELKARWDRLSPGLATGNWMLYRIGRKIGLWA